MPRIPYIEQSALPDDYDVIDEKSDALPDDVDSDFWNEQPTVRTFSNNPELGQAHVSMNTELWTETGLEAGEVECVILAIARAMGSDYEWHDHVIAALERAGLTERTVLGISHSDLEELDPTQRALVQYATEFVENDGDVSDETYEEIATRFDRESIAGLAILAGYYVSLVHVLRALEITLEEEFVGWELENYERS